VRRLPPTVRTRRPLRGELILARCRREATGEHDDGRATAAFKRLLNAISLTLLLIERSRRRHRLEACRAKAAARTCRAACFPSLLILLSKSNAATLRRFPATVTLLPGQLRLATRPVFGCRPSNPFMKSRPHIYLSGWTATLNRFEMQTS
jgi:hypothetical protein